MSNPWKKRNGWASRQYEIVLALLIAAGTTSLLVLLLDLLIPTAASLLLFFLLIPGGALASVVSRSSGDLHPPLYWMLVGNELFTGLLRMR